jgi:hypothetical protein
LAVPDRDELLELPEPLVLPELPEPLPLDGPTVVVGGVAPPPSDAGPLVPLPAERGELAAPDDPGAAGVVDASAPGGLAFEGGATIASATTNPAPTTDARLAATQRARTAGCFVIEAGDAERPDPEARGAAPGAGVAPGGADGGALGMAQPAPGATWLAGAGAPGGARRALVGSDRITSLSAPRVRLA